jgi:hypothetical protein
VAIFAIRNPRSETMSEDVTTPEQPAEKLVTLQKSTCKVTVPEGAIADSWRKAGFEDVD